MGLAAVGFVSLFAQVGKMDIGRPCSAVDVSSPSCCGCCPLVAARSAAARRPMKRFLGCRGVCCASVVASDGISGPRLVSARSPSMMICVCGVDFVIVEKMNRRNINFSALI